MCDVITAFNEIRIATMPECGSVQVRIVVNVEFASLPLL